MMCVVTCGVMCGVMLGVIRGVIGTGMLAEKYDFTHG